MPTVAQIEAASALSVAQAERLRGIIAASSVFGCAPGRFADLQTRIMARVQKQAAITGATNAAPIVVTANGHPFADADQVFVSGVLGNTAANGGWLVASSAANTFALKNSVGNAAYVSGGVATDMVSKTLSAIVSALEACGCGGESTTRLKGGRDGIDSDPLRDIDYLVRQALGLLYTPDELTPLQGCGAAFAASANLRNRAVW